jgi:hypothetical protein
LKAIGEEHRLDARSSFHHYARNLHFVPDLFAPDPRAKHIAAAIKNDQVCVCARAERALPILNPETPRRIERHTFNRFT